MKHTPGPWAIRTLENFGFNVVHYIDGNKFDIARVAKCGDEGDAKLIATAPELLKALQGAVHSAEVFRDSGDWSAVVDFDEWLAYSQEVIAKATQ